MSNTISSARSSACDEDQPQLFEIFTRPNNIDTILAPNHYCMINAIHRNSSTLRWLQARFKETFPFCIYCSPGNGKTVIIAWIHKMSNYSNLYMIYSFVNSYFPSSNWIAAQMSRMSIASQKKALNYHLKHIICQLNTKCSTYWKSQNPHIFHFVNFIHLQVTTWSNYIPSTNQVQCYPTSCI